MPADQGCELSQEDFLWNVFSYLPGKQCLRASSLVCCAYLEELLLFSGERDVRLHLMRHRTTRRRSLSLCPQVSRRWGRPHVYVATDAAAVTNTTAIALEPRAAATAAAAAVALDLASRELEPSSAHPEAGKAATTPGGGNGSALTENQFLRRRPSQTVAGMGSYDAQVSAAPHVKSATGRHDMADEQHSQAHAYYNWRNACYCEKG